MHDSLLDDDRVMQVCFVTPDLEAAIDWFGNLVGKAPVFVGGTPEGGTSRAVFRGQEVQTRYRQCLFRFGNIDIEFIEPGPEPNTWREVLDRNGPGFHHIAFGTRNMTERSAYLEGRDVPVVQTGDYESRDGRYAYFEAPQIGAILELLEPAKDREPQP